MNAEAAEIEEPEIHCAATAEGVEEVHGHSHSSLLLSLKFGESDGLPLGEATEYCLCGMTFTETYTNTLARVQEAAQLHYNAKANPQSDVSAAPLKPAETKD